MPLGMETFFTKEFNVGAEYEGYLALFVVCISLALF